MVKLTREDVERIVKEAKEKGEYPDLSGADLSGTELSGVNLSGVILSEANLGGAGLSEADLTGTILYRADLIGANLIKAKFFRVNLMMADLSAAIFSGTEDLSEANLSGANLSQVNLNGANLSKANLSETNLSMANFIGANLDGADLSATDLGGTDLSRAYLVEANLSDADLTAADLVGANLSRAKFSGADLSQANLSGANLTGADLSITNLNETDLSGANLSETYLLGTNFKKTILDGANFSEATVGNTTFVTVDLGRVKGLETVKHEAHSIIDINTIHKSGDRIPEVFLKQAGVHPKIIRWQHSLHTRPTIFISHDHNDEKEENQLFRQLDVLQKNNHIDIWHDEKIGAGDDWRREVEQAIAQANIAILLISADFLTSDFIRTQVIPALLKRRKKDEDLVIFPIIAKHCAWQTVDWLEKMKVRPKGGQPIWGKDTDTDAELAQITNEITEIIKDLMFK